jgi:serine/threonine-protein kinase
VRALDRGSIVGARGQERGNLSSVVAHHVPFQIGDDLFAPYEVIGELGARPLPVYVGRQTSLAATGGQLVVAERFVGAGKAGNPAGSDLRREARRLTTLANPHLARVREVAVRGDDLVVFGDFIDGEKLAQFWPPAGAASPLAFGALPLEVALRILLDVLTGAGALHALRDATQQPMKLTHGEIAPSTILFGSDGVGRILHAVARRAADVRAEATSLPYLAPEVHSGDAQDPRTDVFSIGVLLWEALEGKALSPDGAEPAGLRVRSAALPAPTVPEKAPWAKALIAVASRALAADPEDRWPTTASMAAEIRKAAGLKLAAASAAAAFAKSTFGDHAKERRARWESASRSVRPAPAASGPAVVPARDTPRPDGEVRPRLDTPDPALAPAPASADLLSVPNPVRGEEFSSSILESYRPPPPPVSAVSAPVPTPPPSVGPPLGPDPFGLEAPTGDGVSSADAPLPFEAPVVFDEMPRAAPAADAPPILPVFTTSDGAHSGSASRRRLFVGGAAALGIALVALVGVRVFRQAPTSEAASSSTQAAAATPAVLPVPAVAPPSPSPSAVASSLAPGASPKPPATPAKPKGGSKAHTTGGPPHTKSSPVHAAGHPKPGSS